jgi:hypothetical protein
MNNLIFDIFIKINFILMIKVNNWKKLYIYLYKLLVDIMIFLNFLQNKLLRDKNNNIDLKILQIIFRKYMGWNYEI